VRTWFQAVIAAEARGAIALSAVLAAWGELAARIDGEVAVEAIAKTVSAIIDCKVGGPYHGGQSLGLSSIRASWARIMSTVDEVFR